MTSQPDAFFYRETDSRFYATDATAGPWNPQMQHGGPPSALLSHAIDAYCGDDGRRTARVAVDLLRPVPVGQVDVDVRRVRSGRHIELVEARLKDTAGTALMVARALRFAVAGVNLPTCLESSDPVPAGKLPDAGSEPPFFPIPHDHGYHRAIHWSFVRGTWRDAGPAFAWMRPAIDLVAGSTTSAWERVLLVADSASGISAVLDPARYTFPNVDLSVSLNCDPVGDWIGFDSSSQVSHTGVGTATSTILDVSGTIGSCTQTLLLGDRRPDHRT